MRSDLAAEMQKRRRMIDDSTFFLSGAFQSRLERFNRFLTGYDKAFIPVELFFGDDSETASTDNKKIRINVNNMFTCTYPLRSDKTVSLLGLDAHEMGHVLYTDGVTMDAYGDGFSSGGLYPCFPDACSSEEKKSLSEMQSKFAEHTGHSRILVQIFSKIAWFVWNCLEDAYVEKCLKNRYGGIIKRGIDMNNDVIRAAHQVVSAVGSNPADWINAQETAILYYALFQEQPDFSLCPAAEPLFLSLILWIEKGVAVPTTIERICCTNQIMLLLWPLVRELADSVEDDSQMEQAIRNIQNAQIFCGMEDSKRKFSPVSFSSDSSLDHSTSALFSSVGGGSGEGKDFAVKDIMDEIAKGMAESDIVEQQKKRMREQFKGDALHDVRRMVCRAEVTEEEKERYREMKPRIDQLSRKLSRSMENVLERKNGGKMDGLLLGRRFGKKLYRKDGRIFRKDIAPEELSLAVGLLVDMSGSMSGEKRIDYAREAAAVLYAYCQQTEIPVTVYGHDESSVVRLHSFAEFDSLDGMDKYRIMGINPFGFNRDGMAIRFISSLLADRPETKKLLIILSDGMPNAKHYIGDTAIEDCQKAVQENKRHGIVTFAAGIGSDKDNLEEIYGDCFLPIDNMDNLPGLFVRLVQRFF